MPHLPPFLTEQWASAYFQILFSVLVFAVGIPFLGLQLVMQEDVRHVVTYRQWKIALWGFLVFVLFLSAISFIWLLHPGKDERKANPAPVTVETRNPADSVPALTGSGEPPTNPPANSNDWLSRFIDDDIQAYIAGGIVTIVPIVALAFGYWLPTNYTRKKVVRQFRDDLLTGYRKKGFLNKDILSKLIYLGEHGNAGIEKNLVLDAFKHIARRVQRDSRKYRHNSLRDACARVMRNWPKDKTGKKRHKLLLKGFRRVTGKIPRTLYRRKYYGRELAELIKSLEMILQHKDKIGNDENYKIAADLLKSIMDRVSGNIATKEDGMRAASMLEKLGVAAVREKSPETAHLYIMKAAAFGHSYVFKLGLEALNAKQFKIANDALNRLETLALAEHEGQLMPEAATSNLLGLLAHYVMSNVSSKKRAYTFLKKYKDAFSPSLERCVTAAINHHYSRSNFETVDQLREANLAGINLAEINMAEMLQPVG